MGGLRSTMQWVGSVDGAAPSKRQELDSDADVVPARNCAVMRSIEKSMGEEWHGCSLWECHGPRRAAQVPMLSWGGTGLTLYMGAAGSSSGGDALCTIGAGGASSVGNSCRQWCAML